MHAVKNDTHVYYFDFYMCNAREKERIWKRKRKKHILFDSKFLEMPAPTVI